MEEDARTWITIFLKGVCMGIADTIPGVSGGTIALITGIYERLITAITNLNLTFISHLPHLYQAETRSALRQDLTSMDIPFLLVLTAGIGTAIITLSSLMHHAVTTPVVAVPTFAFFFGLILASALVLYKYVAIQSIQGVMIAIFGIIFAALVAGTGANGVSSNPPLVFIFFAGSISVAAMVLPGISGAFILLLLGLYTYMSGIPGAFLTAIVEVTAGADIRHLIDPGLPLIVFLCGAILGLISISHAVRKALENYRSGTLIFLIALMLGALRAPVTRIQAIGINWSVSSILLTICAGFIGVTIVLVLDRVTDDLDYT